MMLHEDLIGRVFERLRVERVLPAVNGGKPHAVCVCRCGNRLTVRVDHLLSAHTRSCSCLEREVLRERRPHQRVNLLGRRIGELLVLAPGPNLPSGSPRLPAGRTSWRVRCSCGREFYEATANLTRTRKPTTHCGCRFLKPAAPTPRIAEPAIATPARSLPPLKTTGSAEALRQFHDAHSAIGACRRVCRSVDEDEAGGVMSDFDPFS